jgi:hypothetical protein
MNEENTIKDNNTKNIKNFLINNQKKLIIIFSFIILLIGSYFAFEEIKKNNKIKLAEEFNLTIINFETTNQDNIINSLKNIINKRDNTYSPLALYFILDNNLIESRVEINELFNILIEETNLKKEINNLMIYKKALYNSDFISENELINMLKPILSTNSIWKSHALYLIAEYFYSKNEKQKAKEFFNQILTLSNSNIDIQIESQKRINRDFSE